MRILQRGTKPKTVICRYGRCDQCHCEFLADDADLSSLAMPIADHAAYLDGLRRGVQLLGHTVRCPVCETTVQTRPAPPRPRFWLWICSLLAISVGIGGIAFAVALAASGDAGDPIGGVLAGIIGSAFMIEALIAIWRNDARPLPA